MLNEHEKKADRDWAQFKKRQEARDRDYFKRKAMRESASDKKWGEFKKKQEASDREYFRKKALRKK